MMKNYGVHGATVERFLLATTQDKVQFAFRNRVLANVAQSAVKYLFFVTSLFFVPSLLHIRKPLTVSYIRKAFLCILRSERMREQRRNMGESAQKRLSNGSKAIHDKS